MLRCRAPLWLLLLALSVGAICEASPQEVARAPRPLRLADYFDFVQLGSIDVSPDASLIVYERWSIDRQADAWVGSIGAVAADGSDPRVLVEVGSAPRFSADGRFLAYLRERQIWVLPVAGGSPWQLTDLPEGVEEYAWSPDGGRVVLVSRQPRAPLPALLPEAELVVTEAELMVSEVEEAAPGRLVMRRQAAQPEPPPLDAGEWEADEPEQEADEIEQEGAGEEIESTPEPEPEPDPAVWVQPGAYASPPHLAPRVVTAMADGRGGYRNDRPRQIYLATLDPEQRAPAAVRQLTGWGTDQRALAWSPDGRWIVFATEQPEAAPAERWAIWLLEPGLGDPVSVAVAPGFGSPAWSADSQHLAWIGPGLDGAAATARHLYLMSLYAGEAVVGAGETRPLWPGPVIDLTAALGRPVEAGPQWSANGTSLYVTVQDRGTLPLVRVGTGLAPAADGRRRSRRRRAPANEADRGVVRAVLAGPRVVGAFEIAAGQAFAAVSWGSQPAEVFVAVDSTLPLQLPLTEPTAHVQPALQPPPALLRRLTDLNDAWTRRATLSRPEPIRFVGTDDTAVEGWLMRPPDFEEGRRLPLLVRLSGQPRVASTWAYAWEPQWLAAKGYAVLTINSYGSPGYDPPESEVGLQERRLDDVLRGIDHLVDRGVVDPRLVGVVPLGPARAPGEAALRLDDRFAAMVWRSELMTRDESFSSAVHPGAVAVAATGTGTVSDADRSVVPEAIEIPTLFLAPAALAGTAPGRDEQLYRRLRERTASGGPPTGLILYPRGATADLTPALTIDVWRRTRAWFDRFLLGDAEADPFFGLDSR